MPDGLNLGSDFVLTSLYESSDFPVNTFVVKVHKAKLGATAHQKLVVEQNLDGNACVTYQGTEYPLLENGLPYSPHGQPTGNYTTKRYASFGKDIKRYYGMELFVTWADLTARFPGIRLFDKQNILVASMQDNTFMYLTSNRNLDLYTLDANGYDPVVHTLNLDLVTAVNTDSGRLYAPFPGGDDDKLFLDGELVMPVPATAVDSFSSNLDFMQTAGYICGSLAPVRRVSPLAMIIRSPKVGSWIDKVSGIRVDYIGTSSTTAPSANIWSLINDKILPEGHKTPAELQLVKIEPPTKPRDNILYRVWSVITWLVEPRTLFVVLASWLALWLFNNFGGSLFSSGGAGTNGF